MKSAFSQIVRMETLLFATFAAVLSFSHALAGPLAPPSGPVTSSGRTTTEIQPRIPVGPTTTPGDSLSTYIINQPGSYYLTGNIVATGSKHGITVAADNVSIDLNGFTISQALDGTGFPSGIQTNTTLRNCTVRNGTVGKFRGYGIFGNFNNSSFTDLTVVESLGGQLELGSSSFVLVQRVRTRATTGETGIQVGPSSLVESCVVDGGTVGITASTGSLVRACTVSGVNSVGISCSSSFVEDCTVVGGGSTSSFSYAAISVSGSSRVQRCHVRGTVAPGLFVSGRAEITDCTFFNCPKGVATGAFGSGRATVTNCSFFSCSAAAISLVTPGNVVMGCRFSGNATNIDTSGSTGGGPNGGNAVAEILDLTAGGTIPAASGAANIVY